MTEAQADAFETDSEEATLEAAARLARELPAGSVVHLSGDLGAGKTRFAKGLARGLGLHQDEVCSPTFTLVQLHRAAAGGLGFVHVDLYRIGDPSEADELGLVELPGGDAIAAVEWPERLGGRARPGFVHVHLEDLGGSRRHITVRRPARGTPPPLSIL